MEGRKNSEKLFTIARLPENLALHTRFNIVHFRVEKYALITGEKIRARPKPRLRYGPTRWFSTCRPLFRATSFCGLSERGLMARKNRNHRRHEYVISFPVPYDVIVCMNDATPVITIKILVTYLNLQAITALDTSFSLPFFLFFFFFRLVNFDEHRRVTREYVSQFPSRFKMKIANGPFTEQAFVCFQVHQDPW